MLELVSWKWTLSNEQLYYNQKFNQKYYWMSILVKDRTYPVYGMVTTGNYVKVRAISSFNHFFLNNLTKATEKEPSYE